MKDNIITSAVTTLAVLALVWAIAQDSSYVFRSVAGGAPPLSPPSAAPLADDAVVQAVAKANPAVVSIVVSKDVPVLEKYIENFDPFGSLSPFGGGFSIPIPRYREKGTEHKEVGGGSGFLVGADGLAITNKHVVADDDADYTALATDGKKYSVKVVAKDPFLDIAIIRLAGSGFSYLTLGDSDQLKLGQTVIAIGNALGEFRNSISVGVVSGLGRSVTAGDNAGHTEQLEQVIQTDAAINPGNSGGPLLDVAGRAVGVNVAVALGSENIGFALPINLIRSALESAKTTGEIIRPYLGIRYTVITPELKEKNKLPFDYGVIVLRGEDQSELAVIPGSPAGKAGIVENDIILEFNGQKLTAENSLSALIRQQSVGQSVKLKIWHQGEEKVLTVKLEKVPSSGL